MGHTGLRVIRFHKRYYIFYEDMPWPTCLGKQITRGIPADAAKYQEWLAAQRKVADAWEVLYEDFLSVKPGNEVTANLPSFMLGELPSFYTPLEEENIEFVYVVDLDREIFSVNNEYHFKLEQIPHINWIDALCDESFVDQASSPDPMRMEGITNIQGDGFSLNNLTMGDTAVDGQQIVVAKDIKDIPWRQRHGPILRAITFDIWACTNRKSLPATLRQLSPQDLLFREMAYAVLCLAAGGKHVKLLPSRTVSFNDAFGFVHEALRHTADSEFVSILASGAHLQDCSPGSSPEGTIYWLDDILVVLTAQLYHAGAADEGIARIARYCQSHCATQYVDALLISIEHVVLVHVAPDGKVQHTATMALLDRDAKPYWEKLPDHGKLKEKRDKRYRKTEQGRLLTNETIDLDHGTDRGEQVESDEEDDFVLYTAHDCGNVSSTFYALVHLFEAAACKHMPRAGVTPGRLPNEIYTRIIMQVTDMETRDSLMKVSRHFRQICQEDLLFDESSIIKPSFACQSCDEAVRMPKWFEKHDLDSGTQSRAAWRRHGFIIIDDDGHNSTWLGKEVSDGDRASRKVAIGTEYNKKSLLADVTLEFGNVYKSI